MITPPSEIVDIIVVVRDRFSVFPQCLNAIYNHTHSAFRVTVVAGGVDDLTQNFLAEFETEKDNFKAILMDHYLLQGEARNIGLRETIERFCIILENDTIVEENWLPPLINCMKEEGAAAVMPLIYWYRGLHTAGCKFEEKQDDKGDVLFSHKILYTGIQRKQIDYPENHCVLIDRQLLPEPFDDTEPFDVDLGLTIREKRLSAYLEPRSVVIYAAPPPLKVADVPMFKFRWDPSSWKERNILFMKKWKVRYDPAHKIASYRRQQVKLGLARWYSSEFTIELSNIGIKAMNYLQSLLSSRHSQ